MAQNVFFTSIACIAFLIFLGRLGGGVPVEQNKKTAQFLGFLFLASVVAFFTSLVWMIWA